MYLELSQIVIVKQLLLNGGKYMPEFNVIIDNWNQGIEFKNFFEFGQWEKIKEELKTLNKKLIKLHKDNFGPKNPSIANLKAAFEELAKEYFIDKRFKFRDNLTCIEDFLEERLRSECMYYFWSKCEYEVVIQGWPNKDNEKKIDVFEQLEANWNIFKEIALKEIM